jgi:Icc protein
MPALEILQFTDLHLVAETDQPLWNIDTCSSFLAVLEDARSRYPTADLVLLTGDLAHQPDAAVYQWLAERLQGLPWPVYPIAGNHDDRGMMARLLSGGNVRPQTEILEADWQIVLLDSNAAAEHGGRLSQADLDRLNGALRRAPRHPALICLHHHPVPINSAWMDAMALENPRELFAVLDAHPNVQAVLWGHIHQAFTDTRKGVLLLGTPSTCLQFTPRREHMERSPLGPAYRWLALHPNGRLETRLHYVARPH